MTSTTKVEAKGQCAHCKRVLPVSQLVTLYPGGTYCADAGDCGRSWGQRERHGEAAQQAAEPTQEAGGEPAPAAPLPYIPGSLERAVAEHERLRNAKWPASPADGAEPVQETAADEDAETGRAEAPAAAEGAPETVTDLGGNT